VLGVFAMTLAGDRRDAMRSSGATDASQASNAIPAAPPLDASVATPATPAAETHLVVKTAPPGAEISLDGARLGSSPIEVHVQPGRHSLRAIHRGYTPLDDVVDLASGEVTIVRSLAAEPEVGTIDLYTRPWAYVYFHGRKIAEAPVKSLHLPLGRQQIRLVNPAAGLERTITVDVPSRHPIEVDL
jgi:hypothetical protein